MDITEYCLTVKNCFQSDIIFGEFKISEFKKNPPIGLMQNQYFRIVGSTFDDGVHQNTPEEWAKMTDEIFHGAIWFMNVPPAFLKLCEEIEEWRKQNESADSPNMSPYTSESFGGYSYSKPTSATAKDGARTAVTWQSQFASKLNLWRKQSII